MPWKYEGRVFNKSGEILVRTPTGKKVKLKEVGIEFREVPYDGEFYNKTGSTKEIVKGVEIITPTLEPKMSIEELKAKKIVEVKKQAFNILKDYDWYSCREQMDSTKTIPIAIKEFCASIRSTSDDIEASITLFEGTYDELIKENFFIDKKGDSLWPTI